MRYILDADVLIEARKRYYHPDYCPGFWDWLHQMHLRQSIYSIKAVLNEIEKGSDGLAQLLPKGFFLPEPNGIVQALADISRWVDQLPCKTMRKKEFLDRADYQLVAHGKCAGDVIVTHEKRTTSNEGRIKIPNACEAFEVKCMDLWDILREDGAKFDLRGKTFPGQVG